MVELTPQKLEELKAATRNFAPGSAKTLERLGYSAQEASQIKNQYQPELKVYGSRSQGLGTTTFKNSDGSRGVITLKSRGPQMLQPPSRYTSSSQQQFVGAQGEQVTIGTKPAQQLGSVKVQDTVGGQSTKTITRDGVVYTAVRDVNTGNEPVRVARADVPNDKKQDDSSKPQGTVTSFQEPKGALSGTAYKLNRYADRLDTERIRSGERGINTAGTEALRFGSYLGANILYAGAGIGNFARSIITPKSLLTKPLGIGYSDLKNMKFNIQQDLQNYGVNLATNPAKATADTTLNVALNVLTVGGGAGKIVTKAESFAGLPRYSTTFKGVEIAGTETGSVTASKALTLREGLLSNRKFGSVAISQVKNIGESATGGQFFKGGTFSATREMTYDLASGGFKYGKPRQSGTMFQGLAKEYPAVDGGFVFRGSAKTYGKSDSYLAFAGMGIENNEAVVAALKNIPVIDGKATSVGRGYSLGAIRKNAAVTDEAGTGSVILKGGGDKAKAVTQAQAKEQIINDIDSLIKSSREQMDKITMTGASITEFTKVLPSASAKQTVPSVSEYAGQGTYERTNEVSTISPVIPQRSIGMIKTNAEVISPRESFFSGTRINIRTNTAQVQPSATRTIPSEININAIDTSTKFKQLSLTKTLQLQRQRTLQNAKQIQVQRPFKLYEKVPVLLGDKRPRIQQQSLGVAGYVPYIKRGGKKQYIGGAVDINQALRIGALQVQKDISATFGADRTNQIVQSSGATYRPDSTLFRSYKIRQGKRIPLVNEFITRRGKRLNFKSEVRDILKYKKKGK